MSVILQAGAAIVILATLRAKQHNIKAKEKEHKPYSNIKSLIGFADGECSLH